MDQERIINLLAGENLYSDSCVFVRELLQNSIDAILWRGENDPYFDAKKDGKIKITTWHDETDQGWFKIEDNGTGMDENIIKNYFLRAGRSYYTSDDFEKERDIYSHNKTYKPISRFGIGMLSCFMSDKNNKLEVSTKRYSHDRAKENPGLRLSVTGLKGYYSLAKENKPGVCDWQKMPVQKGEKEEYFRTEPGTTICVGMNLFDLGDYRSIKEVVDKYVQFPDITIEYKGFDGAETYPTKDEFTEAITELKKEHGDTCPIVCRNPIPDEEFKELKKQYRELEWGAAPELVFRYYPLDNYTSGDDLSGVTVRVYVDTKSTIGAFSIGDNTYPIGLGASLSFEENVGVNVNFSVSTPYKPYDKIEESKLSYDEYYRLYSRISKAFSLSDLSGLLSASEKKLLEYAFRGKIRHSTISYNGVFAGANSINYRNNRFIDYGIIDYGIIDVRLLRGSYAPEVNVARDSITKLPIEAAVEFEIIDKSVGNSYLDEISYESGYYYEPEKKLSELIKKHHEWESRITIKYFGVKEISEITKGDSLRSPLFDKRSPYHNVAIAFLKEKYSLSYSVEQEKFFIEDKEKNRLYTSDFPVQMFFKFRDNSELLGVISYTGGINVYSPEHSFSQWLIQNREKLEKELPTVYKKILKIMIMSEDKTNIIKELNEQLTRIKKYGNEDFEITYELYLTEDDLVED